MAAFVALRCMPPRVSHGLCRGVSTSSAAVSSYSRQRAVDAERRPSQQPRSPVARRSKPPPIQPQTDPYLLSEKVDRLKARGMLDAAVALVEASHRSAQSAVVWSRLIDGAAREQRTNLAWKLYNQMKKRGLKPTSQTYTHLFSAFAAQTLRTSDAHVDHATRIFQSLVDDGKVTVQHVNTIMGMYFAGLRVDKALQVYDNLLEGDHYPNVRADAISHTTAIRGLTQLGRNDEAWDIWIRISTAAHKPVSHDNLDWKLVRNILLDLCFSLGRPLATKASAKWSLLGIEMLESAAGIATVTGGVSAEVAAVVRDAVTHDMRILHRALSACNRLSHKGVLSEGVSESHKNESAGTAQLRAARLLLACHTWLERPVPPEYWSAGTNTGTDTDGSLQPRQRLRSLGLWTEGFFSIQNALGIRRATSSDELDFDQLNKSWARIDRVRLDDVIRY